MHSNLSFAPREVRLEKRPDGTMLLRSPQALETPARSVTEWLVRWSREAPERTFLCERGKDGTGWRKLSYLEAYGAARRIGQALLDRKLGPERPVAILSDNSIDHAVLALGAMHVGVPVAPISPAYSLMSKDYAKLRQIFEEELYCRCRLKYKRTSWLSVCGFEFEDPMADPEYIEEAE